MVYYGGFFKDDEFVAMVKEMKVYDQDGEVVAVFSSVKRKGDKLVVDGKALGYMHMDTIFTLEEIFHGIRMALS